MNFDFSIEKELIFVSELENSKDKQKRKRKSIVAARDNLRKCAVDKLFDRMGDC